LRIDRLAAAGVWINDGEKGTDESTLQSNFLIHQFLSPIAIRILLKKCKSSINKLIPESSDKGSE